MGTNKNGDPVNDNDPPQPPPTDPPQPPTEPPDEPGLRGNRCVWGWCVPPRCEHKGGQQCLCPYERWNGRDGVSDRARADLAVVDELLAQYLPLVNRLKEIARKLADILATVDDIVPALRPFAERVKQGRVTIEEVREFVRRNAAQIRRALDYLSQVREFDRLSEELSQTLREAEQIIRRLVERDHSQLEKALVIPYPRPPDMRCECEIVKGDVLKDLHLDIALRQRELVWLRQEIPLAADIARNFVFLVVGNVLGFASSIMTFLATWSLSELMDAALDLIQVYFALKDLDRDISKYVDYGRRMFEEKKALLLLFLEYYCVQKTSTSLKPGV